MENKKLTCEIVRDLLPLYVDDVCTGTSAALVKEHLSGCGECREFEQRIRSSNIENMVEAEVHDVLYRHQKKERGFAFKAGMVIAAIFVFPIMILAIVTAAGEADFSELMIMISGMLVAASCTVVPLISSRNRFARTVLSTTASILLVEFFACLQDGESFAMSAVPTVFGLSIIFLPFVIGKLDLPDSFMQKKALTVISWDCIWFFLTLVVDSMPSRDNAAFREGMVMTALLVVVTWSVYAVAKFSNRTVDTVTKVSVSVITLGLWAAFLHEIIDLFVKGMKGYYKSFFHITNWSIKNISSDILLTLLSAAILFGAVVVIVRIFQEIVEESREMV